MSKTKKKQNNNSSIFGIIMAVAVVAIVAVVLIAKKSSTATDFEHRVFETISGEKISLSDFSGSPLVVNLWATWCPPCRRELPLLSKTAEEIPDINFVFASQREDPARVKSYISRSGLKMKYIIADQNGAFGNKYRGDSLPMTVFIDKDGKVANIHYGLINETQLMSNLDKIR